MSAVRRYFVKRHHAMEKLYGNVCDCEPQCLEVVEAAAYEALDAMYRQQLDDRDKTIHNLRESAKIWEERHATVQEIGRLREALSLCVDRLIGLSEDGLTKIEQVALSTAQAALAQPAAPSARGRMHSCDIPECVACGNPPYIEYEQEGRDE